VSAAIVIVGGVTIIVGTLLPWMTLFAGLHELPGVSGLYGRLIAGAGTLAIGLGVYLLSRDSRLVKFVSAGVGITILIFATILLRNVMAIAGNHRADPMMLARSGSGLYVCLAGAALLCVAVLIATPGRGGESASRQ